MPYCPDCGVEVAPDDAYCYRCATPLESETGRPRRTHPSRTRRPGRRQEQYRTGRHDETRGRHIEEGKVSYALRFSLTDGYAALGWGALLYFFYFLFVPLLPFLGYVYRLTAAASRGDPIRPKFGGVGELTKQGLLYFLVGVLFVAVSAGLVVVGTAIGEATGSDVLAGMLVSAIGLIFWYLVPAVFTLYPVTGSFTGTFSPARIAGFAFTGTYFVAFLVYLLLMFGLWIAFVFLFVALAFTIVGILVAIPLVFLFFPYLIYVTASFWGATYYEMAQKGLIPASPGPADENSPVDENRRPY